MSVLGTKLRLPSPRRRLVQRGRIIDQLRVGAGEGPRLVLGRGTGWVWQDHASGAVAGGGGRHVAVQGGVVGSRHGRR
jgi:hypothetical protein